MRRFIAQLNDMSYINIPADRMELNDDMIRVWAGSNLVAMVDISCVISAHISERGDCHGC